MATSHIESAVPLAENIDPNRSNPPKSYTYKRQRSCFQWWRILPPTYKFFLIVICLVVLLVSYLYLQKLVNLLKSSSDSDKKLPEFIPNVESPSPPSPSILHQFKSGAVCSDSEICSKIGSVIFQEGGNVFDAAIATLLCNGITTAQSMGIGGGFILNAYIHDQKKSFTINAKETAPLQATEDMFKTGDDYMNSTLSIAVPGEIKGYWELHKRYGSMDWKLLVEPTIKVCEEGFNVTKHMSDFIEPRLLNDNHLRKSLFKNGTEIPHRQGEHVHLPVELCNTYKLLAERGGEDFYSGHLADLIADDLRELGSIITKKDLESYTARWEDSLSLPINNNTVYVTPSAGGPFIAFILNILRGYHFVPKAIESDDEQIRTYHRFIEAFKFAFGYRTQVSDSQSASQLELIRKLLSAEFASKIREQIDDDKTSSDPQHYGGNFTVIADKGTSHVSILAPNGDAISVTSSINSYFGTGRTGKRTGIIFNNAMNDFAVKTLKNQFDMPASPANFIEPQKRPMSSMSPTIVTDADGNVRLVIGAAGGTKIITAISTVIARMIWFDENIKEAVDAPRIHHQLAPMEIQYEYGNIQNLITGLELLGHKTQRYSDRGSVICAIAKNQTGIFANADYRKAGEVIGL